MASAVPHCPVVSASAWRSRALVADAPVLVMDEAVSSLDTASERAISQAIATASSGHDSDRGAPLVDHPQGPPHQSSWERGRCVEAGTHDQLVAADGAYARLIASQRGGIVGVKPARVVNGHAGVHGTAHSNSLSSRDTRRFRPRGPR